MNFISLFNQYKNQYKKGWKSYYGIQIDPSRLFSDDSDKSHDNCREFIRRHFEKGRKIGVFDVDFLTEYEENGKHEHTVSLYLLGVLLKNIFFPKIESDLCRLGINNAKWYAENDFMYTWYITCLYHDAASCVEKISEQERSSCNNCILHMKNPYSYEPQVAAEKIVRASKELIKNYCHYRMSNGNKDHGLYGGILLFDRLVKNFEEKTKSYSWEKETVYMIDGVSWRREHLDHFAYISDAIICHNMWTVQSTNEEEVKKYKRYKLDELIIDPKSLKDQRLSLAEYPLHFMLCLLDTIEPVKRFNMLTAREVLENISVELEKGNDGKNKMQVAWKEKIKMQSNFEIWMKNIASMSEWMKVEVSSCNKEGDWCYITIKF